MSESYEVVTAELTGHARTLHELADDLRQILDTAGGVNLTGDAYGQLGQRFVAAAQEVARAGQNRIESEVDALDSATTVMRATVAEYRTAGDRGRRPAHRPRERTRCRDTESGRDGDVAHLGDRTDTAERTAGPGHRGLGRRGDRAAGHPVPGTSTRSGGRRRPAPAVITPVAARPGRQPARALEVPARPRDMAAGCLRRQPGITTPWDRLSQQQRNTLRDRLIEQVTPSATHSRFTQLSPTVAELMTQLAPLGADKIVVAPAVAAGRPVAAVQFVSQPTMNLRPDNDPATGIPRSDGVVVTEARESVLWQRDAAVLSRIRDPSAPAALLGALQQSAQRFNGNAGELWIQVPDGTTPGVRATS